MKNFVKQVEVMNKEVSAQKGKEKHKYIRKNRNKRREARERKENRAYRILSKENTKREKRNY
jgi:hypothetical protein